MSHERQDVGRGPPGIDDSPASERRPALEQDERLAIARVPFLESPIRSLPPSASGDERGLRGSQRRGAGTPHPPCLGLAGEVLIADLNLRRQARPGDALVGRRHGPQAPLDAREIIGLCDLLVPKELGPGPISGIAQILDGPFALAIPTAGGLCRTLPKEWETPVSMTKPHVQEDPF